MTLVMIHGLGGGREVFAPQVERFAGRFEIFQPELRGHGRSANASGPFSIDAFETDLKIFIETRQLKDVILIGHSMGGVLALKLAASRPPWLKGVIAIDLPLFMRSEAIDASRGYIERSATGDYPAAMLALADRFFFRPGDRSELKGRVMRSLAALRREVFLEASASMAEFDAAAALRATEVPVLWIAASVPADLARVREASACVEIRELRATGHYPQLETPEQVSALIETFIDELPARSAECHHRQDRSIA